MDEHFSVNYQWSFVHQPPSLCLIQTRRTPGDQTNVITTSSRLRAPRCCLHQVTCDLGSTVRDKEGGWTLVLNHSTADTTTLHINQSGYIQDIGDPQSTSYFIGRHFFHLLTPIVHKEEARGTVASGVDGRHSLIPAWWFLEFFHSPARG